MPEALPDPAAIAHFRAELLQPDDVRHGVSRYRRSVAGNDRYDTENVFRSNANIHPSA
jgi:hypothetical protein